MKRKRGKHQKTSTKTQLDSPISMEEFIQTDLYMTELSGFQDILPISPHTNEDDDDIQIIEELSAGDTSTDVSSLSTSSNQESEVSTTGTSEKVNGVVKQNGKWPLTANDSQPKVQSTKSSEKIKTVVTRSPVVPQTNLNFGPSSHSTLSRITVPNVSSLLSSQLQTKGQVTQEELLSKSQPSTKIFVHSSTKFNSKTGLKSQLIDTQSSKGRGARENTRMESSEVMLNQGGGGNDSDVHLDQNLLQIPGLTGSGTNSGHTSNALTFTETQNSNEIMEQLRKQQEQERFCDVTLHVQGKQYKAHRNILAACSPYFSSIFKSNRVVRESLAVSCQPGVFEIFLNYMYTGSVTIEKGNVGELLRLANHFLMVKLKGYCGEYLERFLDAENCLSMREIADKFSMPTLAKSATTFVQNNLGEVINHEVMMELSAKQIENFVTEKAWSVPQDARVKFMSRWVCHDLGNRERDFKQLLTNVEWNQMNANVIVDYIDQEPLYGSSERCFYYVLHSLAEKGIQVQKYEQMYQALQQRFSQESEQSLGFGDNLLQMAFNSAMEGLQVPADSTILMPDGREVRIWGGKWFDNDVTNKPKESKSKKNGPTTIEQRRKKILAHLHRNRAARKWIVIRTDRAKRRRWTTNEVIGESSGDEECDPLQSTTGYRCHLCAFVTKKVSRLERHLAGMHGHDVTYRCTECGFTCKWNREYFLHMKSHFEGPPYKCQSCDYTCQKIGSLMAHKVSHVDLKPFQCSECDYKCRSKANLAAHLKTHNNEKPYRCNICGRTFASRNSLDQHAVGHNTDKTYSCQHCAFTTKYLNHFSNHKKTHHGSGGGGGGGGGGKKGHARELYRCQDDACKYTTSKKSQLDSHMRSHAGVRPHVCSICGRRFLEKSHLVRHERIHFNERPFKCEECDYASTRRDKLKEHKTRHHGINASAKSPYKPRPHKNNKQSFSASEQNQNVVYAKKSTVTHIPQQDNWETSSSTTSTGGGAPQKQQQAQSQQQQQESTTAGAVTAITNASGELEFIIPNTPIGGESGAYAQLASTIDLHQMTNSAGIVQLRPFQPGKPEIQVAHTLASIPALSSELQRTLGVKLEDLQAQGIINIQQGGQTRQIKLEDLAGVTTQTVNAQGVAQGLGARAHGATTMVLDSAQLQQLAQAAAASGNPITIASTNNQQSSGNQGSNQSNEYAGGLPTMLF